ncbi:MAG: hypothetical protein NTAFB01_18120 [Nitrospira sp.]
MLITGRLLPDILRETAAVMEKLFGEIGGKTFHPPARQQRASVIRHHEWSLVEIHLTRTSLKKASKEQSTDLGA